MHGAEDRAGLDPRFAASVLSWPAFALATAMSITLGSALRIPAVRAACGIEGVAVSWIIYAYPITYAVCMMSRRNARALSRALGLAIVHGTAFFSVFGACARPDLAGGWALALLMPPCWGQVFPANAWVAFASIFVPPLLRFVSVRDATPRSFVIAFCIGIFCAVAHRVFSMRRAAALVSERREVAGEALGAETPDEAAALATAMRLHDDMSGVVSLGGALARSSDDEAVMSGARRVLSVARVARADLDGRSQDVRTSITRYAEALDVPLRLRVEPSITSPDVADVAIELLGNQAKHAPGKSVEIDVHERGDALVVDVVHGDFAANDRGRGLRWLEARITSRGGRMTRQGGRTQIVLRPRNDAARWLGVLEIVCYPASVLLAWLLGGGVIVTSIIGATATTLLLFHFSSARLVGRFTATDRARVRAAVEAASGAPRALAKEVIDRTIDRLSRAETPESARAALRAVEEDLDAALVSLERAHEQEPALGGLTRIRAVVPSAQDPAP